jgi:hypothetical protein
MVHGQKVRMKTKGLSYDPQMNDIKCALVRINDLREFMVAQVAGVVQVAGSSVHSSYTKGCRMFSDATI